jgi:hypothetical protein
MTEVIVRTYGGRNQQDAALLYAKDAPALAADGWRPTTVVWVADDWSWPAYLVALILVIFVIGIFLLILMGVVKPVRTLLVTYERTTAGAEPS